MKGFITYIKELFDSKSYKWLKTKNGFQKLAVFNDGEKDHYISFDEFMTNAYNLYFYHYDEQGNEVFELTRDRGGKEFEIFGNVKNCVDEFITKDPYISFIGFSSIEVERKDLYMIFLQHICRKNFNYYRKKIKDKEYYFIINKEIPELLKQTYIDNFVKRDLKNKLKK